MAKERIEEETILRARDLMVNLEKRPVSLAEASARIVDGLEAIENVDPDVEEASTSPTPPKNK